METGGEWRMRVRDRGGDRWGVRMRVRDRGGDRWGVENESERE